MRDTEGIFGAWYELKVPSCVVIVSAVRARGARERAGRESASGARARESAGRERARVARERGLREREARMYRSVRGGGVRCAFRMEGCTRNATSGRDRSSAAEISLPAESFDRCRFVSDLFSGSVEISRQRLSSLNPFYFRLRIVRRLFSKMCRDHTAETEFAQPLLSCLRACFRIGDLVLY